MNLRSKNILIVSPEPWNHIFVSKHHYATHLALRGNTVFFLNPPSGRMKVSPTGFDNLYAVDYTGFSRGMRFYPRFLSRRIISNVFRRLRILCGTEFDLVWSFDNSVFFDFKALPSHPFKICHIVDLNQNFQTRRAAETADYCFCTTRFIQERLLQYNDKVAKITHGVNVIKPDNEPINEDLMTSISDRKVTALYSGNLAMPYIDWLAIARMVNENQDVDFLFLGPGSDTYGSDQVMANAKKSVRQSFNVRFGGTLRAADLQQFYKAADILIVAYQERYHNEQANPHKLMEYLAAGKAIVATFTSEYEDLKGEELIIMSTRNSDLPVLFKDVVARLEYWNRNELKNARMQFAFNHTYDKQIQRIEDFIASVE